MIKITIDTFKNTDFCDIYVNQDYKELEAAQGIKLNQMTNTINYYMNEYNLTDNNLITNNVYDEDEYLYTSITEPIKDYLQGSLY